MSSSASPKVLRVAVIVDGEVVEEIHQRQPKSIDVGTGLCSALTIYDGDTHRNRHGRWALLWLAVGLAMFFVGAGLFGYEVHLHALSAAISRAQPVAGDLSSFSFGAGAVAAINLFGVQLTRGELGLILAVFALLPIATAYVDLQGSRPRGRRPLEPGVEYAPTRHPLFVHARRGYHLDLPVEATGKIVLGRHATSITKLRAGLGKAGRIRIQLGTTAKGKIKIGETTVLFQLTAPAAKQVRVPHPREYDDPWQHLRLGGTAALTYGICTLAFGAVFVALSLIEPTIGAVDSRFLEAMEIPTATFEDLKDEDNVPNEEPKKEDVLKQVDTKKVETKQKVEPAVNTKVMAHRPEKFSQKAVERARGVGIARALGTYGGSGEGTVLDMIQGSENNLGELFDAGMTQTVMSNGGDVTAFVAGGKGIKETGSVSRSLGLVTSLAAPESLAKTKKKERRIKGRVKSQTTDIYGDVDKKAVQATIRRRMSALQHCYEKALRTQPNLKGKMSFTITINTMGRVTKVIVEEDSLGVGTVKGCTKGKIKGWRFPTEGAQDSSEVTFSVVFSGAA